MKQLFSLTLFAYVPCSSVLLSSLHRPTARGHPLPPPLCSAPPQGSGGPRQRIRRSGQRVPRRSPHGAPRQGLARDGGNPAERKNLIIYNDTRIFACFTFPIMNDKNVTISIINQSNPLCITNAVSKKPQECRIQMDHESRGCV